MENEDVEYGKIASDDNDSIETSDVETDIEPEHKSQNKLTLQLGDIIQIIAPTNTDIDQMTALITYIDNEKIKMVDVATSRFYKITLLENGQISDESITQVQLLNRSDEKGYARQNGLLPNTWITIHFGGDIPTTITGEISNLVEDMIEIITYPEMTVIYIDFEYKGIPHHIPIEKVVIREKPASLKKQGSLSMIKQSLESGEIPEEIEEEEANIEYTEMGESIITIPEGAREEPNVLENLQELYVEANAIFLGEKIGKITQMVEISEGEQRYGIDEQVNDLMDELLSTIPNQQRTHTVLSNIHNIITRFKELRSQYSKFDDNQNIYDVKMKGPYHKPLVESIEKMDKNLKWLVPVVKNRRFLYDIDDTLDAEDVIPGKSANTIDEIGKLQTDFSTIKTGNTIIEYDTLNKRMDGLLQSTASPLNETNCLATVNVSAGIDAIIDNLDDLYSSVYNNADIGRKRYLIQRYNLGATKLEENLLRNGKTVFIKKPMTPNDDMTIKSIIMLPESVVRASASNGNTSSILEKANLHQSPFLLYRALQKKTEMIPHTIDSFSNEFDYEKLEKDANTAFLKGIHEFSIDDSLYADDEKFPKFLDVIVPKTRFLIKLVKKYVTDKMTFVDVVKQLEPFMIYSSDITYKQYMEIRFLIKERIQEFKQNYEKNSREFSELRNAKYTVSEKPSSLLRLLSEKNNYEDAFYKSYSFLTEEKGNTKTSSPEILYKLLQTDNGVLYNNIVSSIMVALMSPNNLMDALSTPNLDDMTNLEKIRPEDCNRRVLSKKYESLAELQKDNNEEIIYYDKEYDETPYELMDKYKTQQREMLPDLFLEFLIENLVHKHGFSKEKSKSVAIALISKKKMVEDGNYAMLEIKPQLPKDIDQTNLTPEEKEDIEREGFVRRKVYYYRRKNNYWIKDNEIDNDAFIDTDTLFCNISEKCFKNVANRQCESTDDATMRFNAISRKKLLAEFDKRYEVGIEDLEKTLDGNIAYHLNMISKMAILKEIQSHKANYLANALGNQATKTDSIESPFLKLRDMILGQGDFTKKQYDICRFVKKFCREPMVTELKEEPFWKYCLKTNTKLMPSSLYELAETYVTGGDYAMKQEELCAKYGKLSDDGDSWIDENSGFVLRKIDFSTEEGYDDSGFRMNTRDILEKDLGTVIMEAIQKKEKPVFDNEITEIIYNIFSSICTNIDIPIDSILEMVLRISNDVYDKTLISETKYAKKIEQAVKQNKKVPTYKNYKNQNLILITASVLLVGIQTATPSFKTMKSFPGCVRSFSGYPLDGVEDTTGIMYIACVLNKLRSSISVWESIFKFSAETLAKRIEEILKNYVITRDDVDAMYVKKREYMALHPELVSIHEHNISKWHHFMPPVVALDSIKSLRNVGGDFKSDFTDALRKSSLDSLQMIFVLKSRVSKFGFGIIEAINKIVKSKDLLLKTSSQTPFMENACCNESAIVHPLHYFNEENNNIALYLRSVKSMVEILKDVKSLSTAAMFYHPKFTGIRYPGVSSGYDDETIYSAIIKYCNFDRELPVPEQLSVICQERPVSYVRTWSILEKMEFLKKNGKKYNIDDLTRMMSIINRENIVRLSQPNTFTRLDIWKDVIENFDVTNSNVVEEPLRKLLRDLFEKYNPKIFSDKPSDELKKLKNYLLQTNRQLYNNIITFFDKNGNLSNTEYNRLGEFLSNIQKWSFDKDIQEEQSDSGLNKMTQYLRNAVYTMAKIYPSILINDGDFHKKVLKSWGLSDQHEMDITRFIDKYYKEVEKFKKDTVLLRLLQEIGVRLVDLNLFAQHIPIQSEIKQKVNDEDGIRDVTYHSLFDKQTTQLMLVYCFYSTIYEYMNCSYDHDLLQLDIQEQKRVRREKIGASKNSSNLMKSSNIDVIGDDVLDNEDDMREINIETGNVKELQERVCSLLYSFLNIEEENKKCVNMSYADIIQFVNRSKEKEKRGIIKYLGDMSIEERKVEDMFKNYRLGRWNVGQQSGLFKYDPNTYDRERGELMTTAMGEIDAGDTDIVTEKMMDIFEMPMDVDDLDKKDEDEIDAFYENEEFDIRNLGENYTDGAYYDEDQETDDW